MTAERSIAQPVRLGSDPRSIAGRPDDAVNLFGQVLTPDHIAAMMADRLAQEPLPDSVLDPAVGPATFPRSLALRGLKSPIVCFDVERKFVDHTLEWARNSRVSVDAVCADYLLHD